MTDRKFPIGPFIKREDYSKEAIESIIQGIELAPANYRELVGNLSEAELAKTYRDDSWNVRQIVHHVSDIQYIHYLRLKKALTEPENKEMILIDMNAWAATADSLSAPIEDSLQSFEGTLKRYVFLARTLTEEQLSISYYHSARQVWFTQKDALAISHWHIYHHLGHLNWALGKF
ncbi:DinB family protein [Dyadobacter subterraneus]|uniref:DinB family protein n=1 Tax=Dyadobacter subterraneus TaxID=2773304 RepID=A0ABR9W5X2_9BACT|nr:DinB family protein [Dyadobacter subterraneus]MBE9460860.1 DinB family protein [Dyadobacter subterraneus]